MLTPATSIPLRKARWLWEGRIAVGSLALLAGREGLGKSTVAYWVAAQITRGRLPGQYLGNPKSVLVCATEDDWSVTIAPRLVAAGADLTRVHRVEVVDMAIGPTDLVLPKDLEGLEARATQSDAALLLLDPLISRLGRANTHNDAETRQALEPLAAVGLRTRMAIWGLIHPSKATDRDVVSTVMGSRAFTAVSRSVHSVVIDPEADAETSHPLMFGTVKNNLGPPTPTLTFRLGVTSVGYDPDDGAEVTASVVEWGEETSVSIAEAQEIARELAGPSRIREAMAIALELRDKHGGCIPSREIQQVIRSEDIAMATMRRGLNRLGFVYQRVGFGSGGVWLDPSTVAEPARRDQEPTA